MAFMRNIPTYDSDLFSFKDRTFVAEHSDLQNRQIFARLYDDACDCGFAIRSTKTNRVVRFYNYTADMNDDEVAGWRFKPVPEDCRKSAGLADLSVLIIND